VLAEQSYFGQVEDVPLVLKAIPEIWPTGSWVQIGASTLDPDLNKNDPFKEFLSLYQHYSKYFVEPIPELAEKLQRNVADMPHAHVIPAAIVPEADSVGQTVTLYCVAKEPDTPNWAAQVCSFNPEHISRLFPNARAEAVQVEGFGVVELLSRYHIVDVHVLLIDVEGFDYAILRQLPFHDPNFSPLLICYEFMHLSQQHRDEARELLHAWGYIVTFDHENGYAVLR